MDQDTQDLFLALIAFGGLYAMAYATLCFVQGVYELLFGRKGK
jgi:hypothetical protein